MAESIFGFDRYLGRLIYFRSRIRGCSRNVSFLQNSYWSCDKSFTLTVNLLDTTLLYVGFGLSVTTNLPNLVAWSWFCLEMDSYFASLCVGAYGNKKNIRWAAVFKPNIYIGKWRRWWFEEETCTITWFDIHFLCVFNCTVNIKHGFCLLGRRRTWLRDLVRLDSIWDSANPLWSTSDSG